MYEGNPVYEGGIWTLIAVNFIVGLGFVIYGTFFFLTTRSILSNDATKRWLLFKVIIRMDVYMWVAVHACVCGFMCLCVCVRECIWMPSTLL